MALSSKRRGLQIEVLEFRAMLAGNVLVDVVDGSLRLIGDDQDNHVAIEEQSTVAPGGRSDGATLRIAPGPDTSINGNKPGVVVVVSGVTRDLDISLGAGDDHLEFSGENGRHQGNLRIDAGSGLDDVSIAHFGLFGSVSIVADDALDVSVDQVETAEFALQIENHQRGTDDDGGAVRASSLVISESSVRGNIEITTELPLAVGIGDTVGPTDVCKTPTPPGPNVPPPPPLPDPSTSPFPPLTLPDCGSLVVSSSAALSMEIDEFTVSEMSVTIEAGDKDGRTVVPATSSIAIRNSKMRGKAEISSNLPLNLIMDQVRIGGEVSIDSAGVPALTGDREPRLANSVQVTDSVFASLRYSGSESRDALDLVRLRIRGDSHIEMGAGEDTLVAVDTIFGGFASLDGGDDKDLLRLIGTRFRSGRNIVDWD